MRFSHILVDQKFEAEDIERQLAAGQAFADLARRYSKCPSAAQGGDLGLIDPRRLDADFVEAGQTLAVGQISRPVRTRFGYHLIKREDGK